MKKKILSLLVTMGLAASLVPVSVFADGTEVWDGSIAESFAGGKGTKRDPYQIATGYSLRILRKELTQRNMVKNMQTHTLSLQRISTSVEKSGLQ